MTKQALCIRRADAAIDFNCMEAQEIPDGFYELTTGLVDREICEEGSEFLQLIPYIIVFSERGRIFCYERGTAGGEDRLHAKLSIGLGGHVERMPSADESLQLVLLDEAARELHEELGVQADFGGSFSDIVYTGATGQPVDQVHLGLVVKALVREKEIKAEAGHIEGGRFLTVAELMAPEIYDRLEPWSQAMAREIEGIVSWGASDLISCAADVLSELSISSPTGITASATQEVSNVLWALADNVGSGSATARCYDTTALAERLDRMIGLASQLRCFIGHNR